MAVTNPTKHVTVRRLNRFKQKSDQLYATKTELQQTRSDVIEAAAEAVNVEKNRAEGAESTLDDKITTEKTRAEAAEETLDGRIDTLENAVGSGGSVDERIAEAVENAAFLGANDGSAVIADFDPQSDTVHVTAQTLSESQKAQVRTNIGLNDVDAKINEAVASEASRTEAAEEALDGRIDTLENAVGSGGSVDTRISAAVATETTRAQAAESALQNNIEALTQSNIVVVADHTSVSSPDPLTIYREQGTNTYSDWMYQNGSWNKMATYNNAIDDVPTAESENLVKSNGVVSFIEGLDGFNSTSSFLRQVDGASIAFKPKFWFNNTSRVRVDIKFKLHDVSGTRFILSWLSNNVSCYIYSNSNNLFFISGLSSQTQGFLNTFTEGENIILSIERAASGDLVLYVNGTLTNGVGFNSSTLSQSIPTIYVCGYYNDTASNYITDISYIKITNKETGEVQMVNACSKFEEFTAEAHLGFKSMISDIANGEFTLDRTITLAENTHLRGNNCIVHVQNGGQLVLGNGCSVDGFTFVGDWTYNRQAGEGEHRYDLVPLISASSSDHSEVDNAQTYVGTPVIKILGQNATVKNCRFKDIGRLCIEYNDNYMAYTVYTQPCIIDNHFFNCKGAISYLGEFGRISNNTIHSCVYGILLYAGNLNMSSCNFIRNDIAMLISAGHGNEGHSQFVGIECVHSGIAGIYVNSLARNLGDVFSGCQFADAPIIGHHCNSLVITGSIIDTWFELTSGEGNMVACSVINNTTATRDNKPIFYDGATISLKHNIPMNNSISLDSINNTYYM